MRKQGLKLTGKVLAGLVLFSGITAVPTKAIDVQPAAVDVNVKNVKASVYEKEGHFYAKLVADKEVANVVARITTENKAQFLIKRDIIKAGEEVVVELDMKAQVPTRKLPHTGVKKESLDRAYRFMGGHGAWMGFFAFLPILGSAITIVLGLTRANIVLSVLSITIGKVLRYAVLIWGASSFF